MVLSENVDIWKQALKHLVPPTPISDNTAATAICLCLLLLLVTCFPHFVTKKLFMLLSKI